MQQTTSDHVISDVLDKLEGVATGDKVRVKKIVAALGHASVASLLLVPA